MSGSGGGEEEIRGAAGKGRGKRSSQKGRDDERTRPDLIWSCFPIGNSGHCRQMTTCCSQLADAAFRGTTRTPSMPIQAGRIGMTIGSRMAKNERREKREGQEKRRFSLEHLQDLRLLPRHFLAMQWVRHLKVPRFLPTGTLVPRKAPNPPGNGLVSVQISVCALLPGASNINCVRHLDHAAR